MTQTSITPGIPAEEVMTAKVTDRASLISVQLINFSGTVKPLPNTIKHFDIRFDCSTKVEINEEAHRIAVLAKMQAIINRRQESITKEAEAGHELPYSNDAEISVEHALVYQIESFEGLTEQDYGIFANTSGIFHAWPFWREFAHNMSLRMGIPPITIPLFRILPVPPAQGSKPAKTKAKSKS